MSPAAGAPHSVHCWVGVIAYLPPAEGGGSAEAAEGDNKARGAVTNM